MGREKHERHDASHDEDHDKDHHRKRGDDDSSKDASDHQRKMPDAGVRAHGGRWGDGEEMFDIKGRILSISVVGDHSEILIGAGRDQGVHYGMEGYVMNGDTFLSEIDVIGVSKRACRARVDATPDQLREHLEDIVINPSSKPARAAQDAKNWKTRVIRVDIVGGFARLMIGGGRAYGVQAGMVCDLQDENGKHIANMTLEEASARTALGMTRFQNLDEVHRIKTVIVNPG
jgi:hypothetical protein